MTVFATALWFCRQLCAYLVHLLKRCSRYLQRIFTNNRSVWDETDLLTFCAKEWKDETEQAKQMRESYKTLFWSYHVKYIRQVSGDKYCLLRAVLFQIFSQGLPLPSWTKATDILKLPEKLLYSQGCNWIQQYSFGSQRYTGSNILGKLRKCIEALKGQWMEISGIKDQAQRQNFCKALFTGGSMEHKFYEAIKFLMLYQVIEAYELLASNQECIPNFFTDLFRRDTSLDPLSYMMNHLNSIGDRRGLDQIDLFLLEHSLEVKIIVYRLYKINTKDFLETYTDEYQRNWHEVLLLTEDDRHYHIPVVKI
ncbi:inactive ubiquitin thioesterase OTULINL isoform X1 [Ahaetulla prasina]|uniref:inactive ubiquitin thioesterase OTULINL isoform X1 n=1 Tax=Ahaetulla prasina TaxID=499056 RepID=UPI00264794CB|nr:inactive ubiquitin thioesterase OTULINL isoform X1 [Ahaetulla prasina]XP_058034777.1 inactive ubiquitin thioesterase OTULINL isoform X1 [Ahaetulla prasina]XP_058034779.1 inactive ubiquitin thioesterase OTULINL isoform X1 [Ahaetulla prasina]XP_058034780.1 inactive ubiquitin thioesterase OTULINL isoform X1 [Ahaetulla prasina]XP_058034781.1 inactive ubiquitin thioesterase OTULINL isoform X1 [Ahaetulla prasina]